MEKKWLKRKYIILTTSLLIITIIAIQVYAVTCSRSKRSYASVVSVKATVQGTPPNTTGSASARANTIDSSWCIVCQAISANIAYFKSYSQYSKKRWILKSYCPKAASEIWNYNEDNTGSFVYSYAEAYCGRVSTSITAYYTGYCASSISPIPIFEKG